MQSQVRFNEVLEKVPEKVPDKIPEKAPGGFGAEPGQIQHVPEKVPEKVAEAKPSQVPLIHEKSAEVFPALGFPARYKYQGK